MQHQILRTLLAVAALCAAVGRADGEEFRYSGQKSKSISLPGLLGGLANPTTGQLYTAEDPLGFFDDLFAIVMVADTGASGVLLSDGTRDALVLPTTGETYADIGIGGTELFDVTQPLRLMIAPSRIGAEGSEEISHYSNVGDYKMQVRQEDPLILGLFTIDINIVGTPVLNQHVMHIQPNVSIEDLFSLIPTIDYMDTELLPAVPDPLPPGRVIRIPLEYDDFVNNPNSPTSVSTNPVVHGVTIVDSRQSGPGVTPEPMDWLLDTGGILSLIGRNLAESVIGIDLENEQPVSTAEISGVGGETRILFGYQVDELILPTLTGDTFIMEDYVIYVPEEGALPADLPGILGNTLWAQTFSSELVLDITAGPFSHLYVDPFGQQLILIDPAFNPIPEPSSVFLAAAGLAMLVLGRRRFARRD